MNFRAASGSLVEWIDTRVETGFSNFLFVDRNYRSNSVMRRILSLARQHNYQSLLIEEIKEDNSELLQEENSALQTRRSDFSKSNLQRLTFWRCLPDSTPGQEDLIGYAVFKRDYFSGISEPRDYIYEAVIKPSRPELQNNYIKNLREYLINTVVGEYHIKGVLYAQQNDLTFVCAHVALRTALSSFLPEGDITYAKMNSLADIDHQNKIVGEGNGLSSKDIEIILNGLDVSYEKIIHEPECGLNLPTEFQRDLYGIIESGHPALLGFELDEGLERHIVPIIGHTFNNDTWVPDAQRAYFDINLGYFPSESWLSAYVLHDDNFGPYFCLPRHFLKKNNFRIILGLQKEKPHYSAIDAEAVAFDFFRFIANENPRTGLDWYDRFAIFTRSNLLVLRTIQIKKANYITHLKKFQTLKGEKIDTNLLQRLDRLLPDNFWMVEASAQELFSASRLKFGEILLSFSSYLPSPLDMSILLAARLPGIMLMKEEKISIYSSSINGHTPIFNIS